MGDSIKSKELSSDSDGVLAGICANGTGSRSSGERKWGNRGHAEKRREEWEWGGR
jgi:hypothetical protein